MKTYIEIIIKIHRKGTLQSEKHIGGQGDTS